MKFILMGFLQPLHLGANIRKKSFLQYAFPFCKCVVLYFCYHQCTRCLPKCFRVFLEIRLLTNVQAQQTSSSTKRKTVDSTAFAFRSQALSIASHLSSVISYATVLVGGQPTLIYQRVLLFHGILLLQKASHIRRTQSVLHDMFSQVQLRISTKKKC